MLTIVKYPKSNFIFGHLVVKSFYLDDNGKLVVYSKGPATDENSPIGVNLGQYEYDANTGYFTQTSSVEVMQCMDILMGKFQFLFVAQQDYQKISVQT